MRKKVMMSLLTMVLCLSLVACGKKAKQFIISFNTDGGNEIGSIEVEENKEYILPSAPSKDGYRFNGWYLNGELFNESTIIDSDIILDAKWISEDGETYKISFVYDNGMNDVKIEIEIGDFVNEPTKPTKNGYTFNGWYMEGAEYIFGEIVTSDLVITAQWEKNQANSGNNTNSNTNNIGNNNSNSNNQSNGMGQNNNNSSTNNSGSDTAYDKIVNQYAGKWYLEGYKDVFIEVKKYEYFEGAAMQFFSTEFSFPTSGTSSGHIEPGYVIYPCWDPKSDKGCSSNGGIEFMYANWEKDLKANKVSLNSTNITINGNKFVKTIGMKSKSTLYDNITNQYVGKWYLKGYEDVYIDISKENYNENAGFRISAINFDYSTSNTTGKVYPNPNAISNILIAELYYNRWDTMLKESKISLNSSKIIIGGAEFVKTKGTTNRYSNNPYYKTALGTWYAHNSSSVSIEIYPYPADLDTFCIVSSGFDINSLENKNTIINHGCSVATTTQLYDKLGISISNGVLTVKNSKGTKLFYPNKSIVEVKSVSLNKNSLSLLQGQNETLTVTINPTNAYNKYYTWSTSNSNVATIDGNGVVSAVGKGTAIITVTTLDGNRTATCTVTVNTIGVSGIALNKGELNLVKDGTESLVATISPSNAFNKNVIWSSSNTSVATVSSSGVVKAIGKGTAIITVKSEDGNFTKTCTVTVANPKLTVSPSIAYSLVSTPTGVSAGIVASLNASGGTGTYTYYYIKLYKNDSLLAETTNTSKKDIFVPGHGSGAYYIVYIVRDSNGEEVTGTSAVSSVNIP